MKIIIAGAHGQLGQDLVQVLRPDHELIAHDLDELDICDFEAVSRLVETVRPDLIFNTAAFTNVDGCEANPDEAYRVNAIGARNLAVASEKVGSALLYPSTDYVFDGTKSEPYTEFDATNPISTYGRSKLAGENFVKNLSSRYFIVRTSWLYGPGKNFVRTIQKVANEKNELAVVNDQFGSPTSTADLARKLVELVSKAPFGLYHVTNRGTCSWFDLAKDILRLSGLDHVKVRPISTAESKRPAPRPRYSVLRNYCLELSGLSPLRHYEEALRDYVLEVSQKA
ncbi:MAG: dTDP-4-dehydrorhamnose reductase [Terriglobia bacterium]